jgi:hypothetical protein
MHVDQMRMDTDIAIAIIEAARSVAAAAVADRQGDPATLAAEIFKRTLAARFEAVTESIGDFDDDEAEEPDEE